MTTPSKPDLVALAERLEKFQSVLESARRQDNKVISVWSGDPVVVAEAVQTLRHLASQPSLYEAGWEASRREILDRLNLAAPAVENLTEHQEQCDADGIMVKVSRQAVDEVVKAVNDVALIAAITALPADGGEVDYDTNDPMVVERSWPTSDVIDDGVYTDDPRLAQPSIGPSEATPSTAGSVREALERLLAYVDDLKAAMLTLGQPAVDPDGDVAFAKEALAALSAPVEAWAYDWAMGRKDGNYCDWGKRVTIHNPRASRIDQKAIRNLRPLYATPRPLPSVDEIAQALKPCSASGCCHAKNALTLLGGSAR